MESKNINTLVDFQNGVTPLNAENLNPIKTSIVQQGKDITAVSGAVATQQTEINNIGTQLDEKATKEEVNNVVIPYYKQTFIQEVIEDSDNIFNGTYEKKWVDSSTGILGLNSKCKVAIVGIKHNTDYKIKTTGTHNRFTISLFKNVEIGSKGVIINTNNSTTGNEYLEIINTDYNYLVIGVGYDSVGTDAKVPDTLAVTKKYKKIFLNKSKLDSLADNYSNYWVDYVNNVIKEVSTPRSIVKEIQRGVKIEISTKGVHDRFTISLTNEVKQNGACKVIYKGKNNDGSSNGNEEYSFVNSDNYKYVIIGMSANGIKVPASINVVEDNYVCLYDQNNNSNDIGITETKEISPILFAVKTTNEIDGEIPRPIGWLYYTPTPPYKLLYAKGTPDNIRFLCNWNTDITWNKQSSPSKYRPFITKDGDIIFVWRGDLLGLGADIPNVRQNPIIYPADDYSNPLEVKLTGDKPTSWLQNCGADFIYKNDTFIFSEYTRPSHLKANVWKVTKPFTNPSNWKITKSFELSGDNNTGMKHCHTVNYDPFSGITYMTTGDDDSSAKIFSSADFGETWELVLEGNRKYCRVLNFIFTKDKIYWANDDSFHGFFSIDRGVNKIGDFSNITTLHNFDVQTDPPTYVNCYIEKPNGILILNRWDGAVTKPLKVYFWDIKLGEMKVLDEIHPVNGTASLFGFRVEACNFYPTRGKNEIVTGFCDPENNMDLLGNSTKNRINNIILKVHRTADYVEYDTVADIS